MQKPRSAVNQEHMNVKEKGLRKKYISLKDGRKEKTDSDEQKRSENYSRRLEQ